MVSINASDSYQRQLSVVSAFPSVPHVKYYARYLVDDVQVVCLKAGTVAEITDDRRCIIRPTASSLLLAVAIVCIMWHSGVPLNAGGRREMRTRRSVKSTSSPNRMHIKSSCELLRVESTSTSVCGIDCVAAFKKFLKSRFFMVAYF